jgi:hypothetical protein
MKTKGTRAENPRTETAFLVHVCRPNVICTFSCYFYLHWYISITVTALHFQLSARNTKVFKSTVLRHYIIIIIIIIIIIRACGSVVG